MTAALLPSPTSPFRSSQCSTSNPVKKCGVIDTQHLNYCLKLYSVPVTLTLRVGSKVFAGARSQVINSADSVSSTNYSWLPPENSQWVDFLLDSPSDSLSDATDFQPQLQELFKEIRNLISTGKKRDAMDLLKANCEAVKEQLDLGYRGIEEAALLDVVALGYMALGHLKLVHFLLILLNDVVSNLDDSDSFLDSILIHMGSMYLALRKYEMSLHVYQRALRIVENTYGKHNVSAVAPLMGLARVFSFSNKATQALDHYHRVITILESAHGPDGADLLLPLFCLGKLLLEKEKNVDAENAFTRVLSICTKLYGENDERVAVAVSSLAHVKCAQGDADGAISLYRKALEVMKTTGYMALYDDVTEKMRIDLADLLHLVGRENEGREVLEECLLMAEKYKGDDHTKRVKHLMNIATSYSCSKKFVEAERALRMSLNIISEKVGPDDPSVTFPMLQLAVTVFNLKRHKEAEKLALEVLRIREAAFGKESTPVGEALDCLVSIKNKLGDEHEELLDMLKRVLRIQEKEFGPESEEVMFTLGKILFYLEKLGRKDEIFSFERRLSVLIEKFKGKAPV